MNDRHNDAYSTEAFAATALCEALTLALLERGILSGEDLREALDAARDSVSEHFGLEDAKNATVSRVIESLIQQTYTVTPRQH